MATAHYNKIQIARGKRSKKTPLVGELFFDTFTKGVYIGKQDGATAKWVRFGGFESIVLKGVIENDMEFDLIKNISEPGDAYIVSGPIKVVQKEIIYDNNGNVTRSDDSVRTYDDFFKAGQVIVYCESDVSSLPNSCVTSANNYGFITLAGASEANDLENDTLAQPIAKSKNIKDVQSALDYLFNHKIEYIGSFDKIELTSSDYKPGTHTADEIWALIADKKNLLAGEMLVYRGNTKRIDVNGTWVTLKKNTAIIKVADVKKTTGPNPVLELDQTVYTLPLGSSEAGDLAISFTAPRKSNEPTASWKSKNENGADTDYSADTDVKSIQQAVDDLLQTKADLNAQGKIPLDQIPNTFVGALQYIGTVDLSTENNTITAKRLVELMGHATGKKMEKPGQGGGTDIEYARVDAGDYVIVKCSTTVQVPGPDGSTITQKKQIIVNDDANNFLFKVSEGDHVICTSITYASDNVTVTDVELDHLNTSSAVDAVNGITAEVEIVGNKREVPVGASDTNTNKENVTESVIVTDPTKHTIQVTTPNAVLAHEDLTKKTIPVGSGKKNIVNSEVSINPVSDITTYKNPGDPHNTELVGKTSGGTQVTIEFPDTSGKMTVTQAGSGGTENFVPKYDANGNLINSDIKNIIADNKVSLVDNVTKEEKFSINYGNSTFGHKFGTTDITHNFDDDDRTSHEKRIARDKNTHTLLDDCSIIDCGVWE